MKKLTITISEELADLISKQQRDAGHPTLDEAVTELLSLGLVASSRRDNDETDYSAEELDALIQEGEDSGPAVPCDGKSLREEVLRRYAELKRSKS